MRWIPLGTFRIPVPSANVAAVQVAGAHNGRLSLSIFNVGTMPIQLLQSQNGTTLKTLMPNVGCTLETDQEVWAAIQLPAGSGTIQTFPGSRPSYYGSVEVTEIWDQVPGSYVPAPGIAQALQ